MTATAAPPPVRVAVPHPHRDRILALMGDGQKRSPNQIAEALGQSLGVVAYHVRVLAQRGQLDLVDETRVRGAVEHHYRATRQGRRAAPATREQLDLVIDAAERRYRELLNQASDYERRRMQPIADETMRDHVQPLRDAIDAVKRARPNTPRRNPS